MSKPSFHEQESYPFSLLVSSYHVLIRPPRASKLSFSLPVRDYGMQKLPRPILRLAELCPLATSIGMVLLCVDVVH